MNAYIQYTIRLAAVLAMALPLLAQAAVCSYDIDCSNGLFCDGRERCEPSNARANAQGCVPANLGGRSSVCGTGESCDEARNDCYRTCPDADGDGHESAACGGDDCDDHDASRYPGATEVCSYDGHDEDCNDQTVGFKDSDGDGHIDAGCANY